jgi:acyl-coenzyme A synthetase/AMP-(fatty) acid ligase
MFFVDPKIGKSFDWELLINDINNTKTFNPYCNFDDYYSIFKNIIISILIEENITLLDSDFTTSELFNLTGLTEFSTFSTNVLNSRFLNINSKTNLIERVNNCGAKWSVTLFTSGTTGSPKNVCHSFQTLTRFVNRGVKQDSSIWGFAYNPTHMAGLQVFFQAFLNGNTIVRLFDSKPITIYKSINTYKITHISATPTFYRQLIDINEKCETVLRITSGGEKFNTDLQQKITKNFPNAKVTNVYASSEAGTLLASKNDKFYIKVDYKELIKIENNELIIHSSLLGKIDILETEWYKTGDIVEILNYQPLEFIFTNRKNDIINIGGYNVNPQEVEECLLKFNGIQNAMVYSKANTIIGNILCCEIISSDSEITEKVLRKYLQTQIQEFKIPRLFRFVNEINTTRTGKIKRI